MLVITYSPKDAESREFKLDGLDDLESAEAELIESVGAWQWQTFGQWVGLFSAAGFRAWRALLWVLLRRADPEMEFDALAPRVGELQIQGTAPEVVVEGKSGTSDEDTGST